MPRGGSVPAHAPGPDDFSRLARYPFVVVSWVADDRYPTSVATDFRADAEAGVVRLRQPTGDAVRIPDDRTINVVGSHIRPQPGQGYDERRYLQMWGTALAADGEIAFRPTRVWGWDEQEVPFFEYSERSVPQSRHYLARLSAEKGRLIRPRLDLGALFFRTTRLPFLSATFVPVLLGMAIAALDGAFNPWLALLTVIGAAFAHLGINVANDIFDTLSGADQANVNPTKFSGGSRVLLYDLVTLRELIALDALLFGAAAAIGLALVWATGSATLLAIGIAGIAVGVFYTAPPLKLVYRGLGEFAVALGFGPIMLLGAYVVQTGTLSWEAAVASVPVAILIALVLYVNEIPDRVGDAAAGKRTLPVRLPPALVTNAYLGAALAAFGVIVAGVAVGLLPPFTLLALLALPLAIRVYRGIGANYSSPYGLMAYMGVNVNLHLLAGLGLLTGYAIAIVVAQLT
ncbi:MAG TPA: prenyltransferase [Candidatus Limnocylindria bacterium]|nr:prenyltransferase [Candidatus Limnocylindria bacterium]